MAEDLVTTKHGEGLIGQLVADRYEISSLVGEGGMGLVYKARHVLMNRWVAIKMIRQELVSNMVLYQRFQQEAKAISKLDHPNIVKVYDFGVTPEGTPFLVMDYLEGKSLSELIGGVRRIPVDRAIPLFIQACQALDHAHGKGVIHRDFKASNLMICREGGNEVVKVVDFGMAKLMRPDVDETLAQELTQTGEVFGSPLYMSPEQCKGQKLDERSDIYSLACVMYYALAGRPPHLGENVLDTLQKQIHDDAEPVSKHEAQVQADLDEVVLKALRKNPDERYQNITELLTDLEAIRNGQERVFATHRLKPLVKKKKAAGKLLSHNFEMNMVVVGTLVIALISLTAFMSGRMFEVAADDSEINMWVDRNMDGDRARTNGNLPLAQRYYKQAVAEASKFGHNDPRLAKSLVSLGGTYLDAKDFPKAKMQLKRAMTVLEKCYGRDCSEQANVLTLLSRVADEQGDQAAADEYQQRAAKIVESSTASLGGVRRWTKTAGTASKVKTVAPAK